MTAPSPLSQPSPAGSAWLERTTVAAVLAGVGVASWRLRDVYPDDALIVLRYAANILDGHGWVYNVGEAVNATTSPLHVLFLTGLAAATGGQMVLALVLAFAIPLAAIVGLAWSAMRAKGPLPALCAALFVAFGPNVYGTLGMESTLLIACALGAVTAHVRGHPWTAGILLGLATLARPDAALLGAVLAVDAWRNRRSRDIAILAAGGTLVNLPWLVFATARFGSPLPNTLAIKLAQRRLFGDGPIFLGGAWREFLSVDVRGLGVPVWLMASTALVAVITLAAARRQHRVPALFATWATLQFAAYALLNLPPYHWYYAPASFAALLALGVLVERTWNSRPRAPGMALSAALTAAVVGVSFPEVIAPQPTLPHYRAMGSWLAENAPPGATVACADIGIIGYLARPRTIVDMQGLVDTRAAESIRNGDTAWWLRAHDPDVVLLHVPPWRDFEAPALEEPAFTQRYQQVSTPTIRGMSVWRRAGD